MKPQILILFFIVIFSQLSYSQATEKDYINFTKNGIVLSTYLSLGNADKLYEYLDKLGYVFYETESNNKVVFYNLEDPLCHLIEIGETKDGIKQINMRIKKEINTFKSDLYYTIDRNLSYNIWSQLMATVEKLPTFKQISHRSFYFFNDNGELEIFKTSNFHLDIRLIEKDTNKNITLFRTPNGGFIHIIFEENKVEFISFKIVNDGWVTTFLEQGLNETIWFKE